MMLKHNLVLVFFVTMTCIWLGMCDGHAAAAQGAAPTATPSPVTRTLAAPTATWALPEPIGTTPTPSTTPIPTLALSRLTISPEPPYGIAFEAEPESHCVVTATQSNTSQDRRVFGDVVADSHGRVRWTWPADPGDTWTLTLFCEPGGQATIHLALPPHPPETLSPEPTLLTRARDFVVELPPAMQIAGVVVAALLLLQVGTVGYNTLARWQIARHTHSLHTLTDAMSLASQSFSLEKALGDPADLLLKHLQLPTGVVHLLNLDHHRLEMACARGVSSPEALAVLPRTDTLMGEVIERNRPARFAGPANQDYLRALSGGKPRVCMISVPIADGHRVLGALTFATPKYRAFTEDEIELMTGLGRHLGTVVENLRMVDAMRAQMAKTDAALADLRASERVRGELLDNISHDLRAPLTYVKGYVDLLLEGEWPPSARDGLQIISDKARQMIGLIEELLASEHPELFQLHCAPVELGAFVRACVSTYQPAARKAGITLDVDLPDDLPPVWADAARLTRVFDNLVTNALKFTPREGRITLSASSYGDQVEIRVADTGRGIAPDQLEHIFDRFYRAEHGQRTGGLGLGLAIAKDLVTAHGGMIWAESELGQGTVFHFTLPLAMPTAVSQPTQAPSETISTPTMVKEPPLDFAPMPAAASSESAAPASIFGPADEEPLADQDWRMEATTTSTSRPQSRVEEYLARLNRFQRLALGAGAGLLLVFIVLFVIVSVWQQTHW